MRWREPRPTQEASCVLVAASSGNKVRKVARATQALFISKGCQGPGESEWKLHGCQDEPQKAMARAQDIPSGGVQQQWASSSKIYNLLEHCGIFGGYNVLSHIAHRPADETSGHRLGVPAMTFCDCEHRSDAAQPFQKLHDTAWAHSRR